jgi:hypothetical protein
MRAALNNTAAADLADKEKETLKAIEIDLRARLQSKNPNRSPEDIEARVAEVMKRGLKPTTAVALEPGRIPQEVVDQRKAERKRTKKNMARFRK